MFSKKSKNIICVFVHSQNALSCVRIVQRICFLGKTKSDFSKFESRFFRFRRHHQIARSEKVQKERQWKTPADLKATERFRESRSSFIVCGLNFSIFHFETVDLFFLAKKTYSNCLNPAKNVVGNLLTPLLRLIKQLPIFKAFGFLVEKLIYHILQIVDFSLFWFDFVNLKFLLVKPVFSEAANFLLKVSMLEWLWRD